MPETNVTTAITAATPITTPSSVSTERSLFAHSERNAMRMDSRVCINRVSGVRQTTLIVRRDAAFAPLPVYSEFRQNDAFYGHPELLRTLPGKKAGSDIINL